MKPLFLLLAAIILSISPKGVRAGGKASEDAKLREIMSRMKAADGCAYNLSVFSELLTNKTEHQTLQVKTYYSKSDFVRYTSSAPSRYLICKKGMFKADNDRKEVVYKQFTNDSMWQKARQAMTETDAAQMMDSLFLKNAVLTGKANKRPMLIYKLSYPTGSMITGLELVYNTSKDMLRSITYTLDRSVDGSGRKGTMIHQKVSMTDYEASAPDEVKQILQHSDDLKSYLQQAYAGYKIINL